MSSGVFGSLSWDLLGRMVRQISGFVVGIVLARLLGPKEFGIVGLSMAFISTLSFFISTGLFSSLIQRVNIDEGHKSSVFYFNILIAGILFGLSYVLAPYLTLLLKTEEEFTRVIRALSLILVVSAFGQVQEALLRREMEFKKISIASFVSTIFGGSAGVIAAFYGLGVWSLVIYSLLEKATSTLYFWMKSSWVPKLFFRWYSLIELWRFGFNMFLTGLLGNIVSQIDSVVISRNFSVTELGLYSRAKTLNGFVVRYSSESIGAVMFPALSKLQSNMEELISKGLSSTVLVAFVSFGLLGWLYLTAEEIILIVLGDKWIGSIEIYKMLCLSGWAIPLLSVSSSMIKAVGDSRLFLKLEITRKSISVIGLLIGFLFGMEGFLLSLIFSGIVNVLLTEVCHSLCLQYSLMAHLKRLLIYPVICIIAVSIVSIIPSIASGNLILSLAEESVLYTTIFLSLNIIVKSFASETILNRIHRSS